MAASRGNNILIPDKNAILEQTFYEALQSNLNSVQKWTNWKDDHEKLKKTLLDLPNKLSHPGVIPFGPRALVKADIVHTNEILSCVGDGYFIKQSAKQAIDMCDRRIKDSDRMLKDLEKEQDLIRSRQILPKLEEAFPNEEHDEIVEEYDEAKEAEWRLRHREMEKKYHQELAELRKTCKEEGPPQTEEDLFRRLDMLELEEELNDELARLNDGTDSDESDEEGGGKESEEEIEKQDIQEKDTRKDSIQHSSVSTYHERPLVAGDALTSFEGYCKVSKNSPLLEPGQVSYGFIDQEGNEWQKSVLTQKDEEICAAGVLPERRKSVSFASDEDEPISAETQEESEVDTNIFIQFEHSNNEFQEPPTNQTMENGDIILINSPKDIYKQYVERCSSSEPKSILKKKSSYEGSLSAHETIAPPSQPFGAALGLRWQDEDDCDDTPQSVRHVQRPILPPVLRDVSETNPNEPAAPLPESTEARRPVSRFKASRAASRR